MNETMVTVTGNVAGDVITKRVGANQEHLLVTFRVASSERRYDRATDSWVDGDRFTALVNCWRRLADGARLLVKGDPVVVTGRLSVREYEVEGVRRYMTEISATAVGPDLGRCTATVNPWRTAAVEGADGAAAEVTAGGAVGPLEADRRVEEVSSLGGPATDLGGPAPRVDVDGADGAVEAGETPPEGATVTGIATGERRRSASTRASA
ncbi:single-stranded DNA-binding protein [Actinomycetospora flava]|uniref:Single-stranded DNA-binding protein n=1 Tax=Actinomycetospora flava TaxID=3129232 RepID=A0ABU8M3K5_9PSEU